MTRRTLLLAALLGLSVGLLLLARATNRVPVNRTAPVLQARDELLASLTAPPGFVVDVVTREVPNARGMARSPGGVLYVGSRDAGTVYAVLDADQDHHAERVITLATGLDMPVGLDVHDGDLYVSAVSRILRFDDVDTHLDDPRPPVVVVDDLPGELHHGWRYLRFGPDGLLYVAVGAPCNVCERPDDPRFATILRMHPDGSEVEIVARGVRNSVGFTWHPVTGDLWFTDNGRDLMGDDTPPCELNHLAEPGQHFGFPYCHGGTVPDPSFEARPCDDFVPPARALGAHVAPLGLAFHTGDTWPEPWDDALLVAEHGSWNRTVPQGYRVMAALLDGDGRVIDYRPFLEGWLTPDGEAWGRPVDVLLHPDGSVYVSDDRAGWIVRVGLPRR